MQESAATSHASTEQSRIAAGLEKVLADSYTLYLKTQNYHWNVKGPLFHTLHAMFEEQYTELAIAIDEIAERIRALGSVAPGSFTAYQKLSAVREETELPDAQQIANLIADQAIVVQTSKSVLPLAQSTDDEPTADLLIRRMQVHEKHAWMLRSLTA